MFRQPSFVILSARPSFQLRSATTRNFVSQASRLAESSTRSSSIKPTSPKSSSTKQLPRKNGATDIRFLNRRTPGLAELDRKVAHSKTHEVLLYKASSQRSYIASVYGIAAFAFGYAVINSSLDYQDKQRAKLANWQKSLNIGICVVMSVMGTVYLSRGSRLVRDICAVDIQGQTLLKVRVRSSVPFRKPYTLTIAPNQILFHERLVGGSARSPLAQDVTISFWKNPLKAFNFGLFKLFISMRRVFTQEDFIMMEMQGQKGAFRVGIDGFVSNDLLAITSPRNSR